MTKSQFDVVAINENKTLMNEQGLKTNFNDLGVFFLQLKTAMDLRVRYFDIGRTLLGLFGRC